MDDFAQWMRIVVVIFYVQQQTPHLEHHYFGLKGIEKRERGTEKRPKNNSDSYMMSS